MGEPQSARVVTLSGALTTAASDQTHETLMKAFDSVDRLVIDCGGATDVDLSFLQLLIAAQRTAANSGRSLSLAAPPSDALAVALKRCGFAPRPNATALADILVH